MTAPIPLFKPNSGKQPDSAARGTRPSSQPSRGPESHPNRLGADLGEVGLWLLIAALVVACILVGTL